MFLLSLKHFMQKRWQKINIVICFVSIENWQMKQKAISFEEKPEYYAIWGKNRNNLSDTLPPFDLCLEVHYKIASRHLKLPIKVKSGCKISSLSFIMEWAKLNKCSVLLLIITVITNYSATLNELSIHFIESLAGSKKAMLCFKSDWTEAQNVNS